MIETNDEKSKDSDVNVEVLLEEANKFMLQNNVEKVGDLIDKECMYINIMMKHGYLASVHNLLPQFEIISANLIDKFKILANLVESRFKANIKKNLQ